MSLNPIELRLHKFVDHGVEMVRIVKVWGLANTTISYVQDWKAYLRDLDWMKIPRIWE